MPEVTPHLTDEEMSGLDRELSQLVAVDPSPEFTAKVRARIGAEPAREKRWFWVCAPAAVVAAAVLVLFTTRSSPRVPVAPAIQADIRPRPEVPAVQQPNHGRPSTRTTPRRATPRRTMEPQILIDPSLAAAIRRLASEQPALPEVPPEPSLDPVVVEPLKVPDIGEAVGAGLYR